MMKAVWRFNLAQGVDEREFFSWLRRHVWDSSAEFGCETRAAWQASAGFAATPDYPGFDSPWGAQSGLERRLYREISG